MEYRLYECIINIEMIIEVIGADEFIRENRMRGEKGLSDNFREY